VLNGMLGMGAATLDDIARLPAHFVEFTPQLPEAAAAALVAGWQHAVRQTLT
jgi:hypothetical protein